MKRETHLRRFQDRFLLIRLLFVLAVAVLGVCEVPQILSVISLVGFMLLIELYLKNLPPFSFCNDMVLAGALIADTVIVSGVLVLASVSSFSFIMFFAALILVAYVENLIALGILTTVLGGVALFLTMDELSWARIPFLTAAGQYYAYLVSADKLLDPAPPMRVHRPGQQDVHVIEHGGGMPRPASSPAPASPWETDEPGTLELPSEMPEASSVVNELSRLPLRTR